MRRRTTIEVDLDALQQRVTDLEALLVSPGWAVVAAEANKLYGVRTFVEQIESTVRSASGTQLAEEVIARVAARAAAGRLINLPSELLEDVKRKIASATPTEPRARTLGPNVEVSQ